MKHFTLVAAFALVSLYSSISTAQTRYVTDSLEIMMRSGPSNKNKIIKILSSGESLQVINAEAGNGHSEVRNAKGDVGFVLSRYLSEEPSARNRVKTLEAQLQQLRAKPGELQALLAKAQEDNQVLIKGNTELTASLNKASTELEKIKRVSSDAVNIANRNTKLEGEVQELLLQLDDIRIQNKVLKDQSSQSWFMKGAGVILFGIFLGWMLTRSRRPSRQSWGS